MGAGNGLSEASPEPACRHALAKATGAARCGSCGMLSISGLSKRFGRLAVLENFSARVERGGFTVLVGPSGCGKSTLFDVLTGVVRRDAGRIAWLGSEVEHLGRSAAYMQQKDLLLPWLTLLDNALLPARVARGRGCSRENDARARGLFARLGLEGFEGHLPGRVSGGMRQRCALVRTLMFDHELVLLDEPLSALDAITRSSLQSLLLMLQKDFGKTLLMITHDVEEALLLADELLVLSRPPMRPLRRIVLGTPKPRRVGDPDLARHKERILRQLGGGSDR